MAIKLGQLLATRADIFGVQFARDLGQLKDALPPFPIEPARQGEVEAVAGAAGRGLFRDFGPPVAAASPGPGASALLADRPQGGGQGAAPRGRAPGGPGAWSSWGWAARLVGPLVPLTCGGWSRRPSSQTVDPRSMVIELDLRLEAAAPSS